MRHIIALFVFAVSCSLSAEFGDRENFVEIPNDGIYLNVLELGIQRHLLNNQTEQPIAAYSSTSAIQSATAWARKLAYSPIWSHYNRDQILSSMEHPANVWLFCFTRAEWEQMGQTPSIFPQLPWDQVGLGVKVHQQIDVHTGEIKYLGAVVWTQGIPSSETKIYTDHGQRIDGLDLSLWPDRCGHFRVARFDPTTGLYHLPTFGDVVGVGGDFYYHNKLGLVQLNPNDPNRYITTIVTGFGNLAELGITQEPINHHTLEAFQLVLPDGVHTVYVSGATYAGQPEIISLMDEGVQQNRSVSYGYIAGVVSNETAASRGLWVYSRLYGDIWLHSHFYPYIHTSGDAGDYYDFLRSAGHGLAGRYYPRWRNAGITLPEGNYNAAQQELLQRELDHYHFSDGEPMITLPIQPIDPMVYFNKEEVELNEPVIVAWWSPGVDPLVEYDGLAFSDRLMARPHQFTTPGTHTVMMTIGSKVFRDTIYVRDEHQDAGISEFYPDSSYNDHLVLHWKTINTPILRVEGWRGVGDNLSRYMRLSLYFVVPGERKITLKDKQEITIYAPAPGHTIPDPRQLQL